MNKLILSLILLLTTSISFGQKKHPYYGGGYHTRSHGGYYEGSYTSNHRGGHYVNASTRNTYGRHKRR